MLKAKHKNVDVIKFSNGNGQKITKKIVNKYQIHNYQKE